MSAVGRELPSKSAGAVSATLQKADIREPTAERQRLVKSWL